MKLTKHFTLEEFTRSSTAKARGIDNTVPEKLIPALRNLCETVLEPLREQAKEPVEISSGYRCPELNRVVGGKNTSQHMKGEACDIWHADIQTLRKWFAILMDGDFDHYQNLNLIKSRVCSKYSTDCVSREVLIIMFDNNICSHEQRPA